MSDTAFKLSELLEPAATYLASMLVREHELYVRTFFRNYPSNAKSVFGGGSRPMVMPKSLLEAGLRRAARGNHSVLVTLWRETCPPIAASAQSARTLWRPPRGELLAPRAIEWLAARFQPTVEELAFVVTPPAHQETISLSSEIAIVSQAPGRILASTSLQGDTEKAYQLASEPATLALELVGMEEPKSPEACRELDAGDFGAAAIAIERSTDLSQLHLAVVLNLLAGNSAAAAALVPRLPLDSNLAAARADGLSAIVAIVEHDFVLALEILDRAERRLRDPWLVLWPTWSLMRGISRFGCGDHQGSAREFLAGGVPGRGNAVLPLLLAAHSFRTAGAPLPNELSEALERQFLTFDERKRLEEVLQAHPDTDNSFAPDRAASASAHPEPPPSIDSPGEAFEEQISQQDIASPTYPLADSLQADADPVIEFAPEGAAGTEPPDPCSSSE